MNRKIDILDDLTINKIAAGEVVEAPYSVVKELVENAIDAGASTITLEIKDGGKKYIRITDNGAGIKEEYVEKAFMRHSTSKITNIDDLNNINSLGFRGEALASIAAVSQAEMITRPDEQQYGILIEITGGKTEIIRKVGCPVGTTIIIKNLFFNTPARLKFMKSNNAETMKITEIIIRLSLSNPGIAFKYINNNNIMFTTPGNNILSQAILSVFDKDTFKNLISLEQNELNMKLHGYIGQPSFVRGNRNLQIIYVNGRYVKNKLISKAIEEAYKEKIIINKHPVCILNLNIDPSLIDVNVHPAKTEVKFEAEEQIYDFIYKSIISALQQNTTIPNLIAVKSKPENYIDIRQNFVPVTPVEYQKQKNISENASAIKNVLINETQGKYIQDSNTGEISQFIDDKNNEEQLQINSLEEDIVQFSFLNTLLDQYKIVGQIFNTYIVLEKDQSMYLIDQHAAHERLLYNKFLEEIKNEKVVSQRLIESKVLELSSEDYMLLSNNMSIFRKLGFEMEDFGINAIIIRQVPMILGKPQNFSFIYEILDEVRNNNNIDDYFEDTIIKRACKEAIKAKDRLDYSEIKKLIDEIYTLTPPLTCPHGRPIILTMGKYEIEKHFKRIQ
ncbi:DNA mismatch repair endonuclease MutL [Alkaliphilus sp. MSJ-5]|uniref:DNA mismatch repair protein MutL n=1 Tax=Alkaliphilus flagellatus TaxID=2841507 RepID=A0ABS6G4T5_9FIRM|nr:DNA mismatch repair endonuclease MutL [Alkaliphilus flagellatus]MBU5677496.1 DNA mismatch repair endonuclease MutL [Alkaliphilus flagellatus]